MDTTELPITCPVSNGYGYCDLPVPHDGPHALRGPVAPAVTRRTLTLLADAEHALTQAVYEGSHKQRQDPAPMHGSPWDTPDLPADALAALQDALVALRASASRVRVAAARQADPNLARR